MHSVLMVSDQASWVSTGRGGETKRMGFSVWVRWHQSASLERKKKGILLHKFPYFSWAPFWGRQHAFFEGRAKRKVRRGSATKFNDEILKACLTGIIAQKGN